MISETEKLAARRAALAKLLRLAYELGREDERERPGKDCSRDFAEDAEKLATDRARRAGCSRLNEVTS